MDSRWPPMYSRRISAVRGGSCPSGRTPFGARRFPRQSACAKPARDRLGRRSFTIFHLDFGRGARCSCLPSACRRGRDRNCRIARFTVRASCLLLTRAAAAAAKATCAPTRRGAAFPAKAERRRPAAARRLMPSLSEHLPCLPRSVSDLLACSLLSVASWSTGGRGKTHPRAARSNEVAIIAPATLGGVLHSEEVRAPVRSRAGRRRRCRSRPPPRNLRQGRLPGAARLAAKAMVPRAVSAVRLAVATRAHRIYCGRRLPRCRPLCFCESPRGSASRSRPGCRRRRREKASWLCRSARRAYNNVVFSFSALAGAHFEAAVHRRPRRLSGFQSPRRRRRRGAPDLMIHA